eukprot:2073329-Pleurochrysis_carterae.AAC.2
MTRPARSATPQTRASSPRSRGRARQPGVERHGDAGVGGWKGCRPSKARNDEVQERAKWPGGHENTGKNV